jgi:hypothetical protein
VYLYNLEEDKAARLEAIHAKLPTVAALLGGTKTRKRQVSYPDLFLQVQ